MVDVLETPVLVLNKMYAPIGTISVKEAFSKFWSGAVEAILVSDTGAYEGYNFHSWAELSSLKELFDESSDWVHTPQLNLVVPRIVRTLVYEKQKRVNLRPSRRNIYERDKFTCQYCGKSKPLKQLNLDHVFPRGQGGKSTWENLVCSCIPCNEKKACRTPREAGMSLIKKPSVPASQVGFMLPHGSKRYQGWDNFVSEIYWTIPLEE